MIFVLFICSKCDSCVSLRGQGQLLVTLQGQKGLTDFRDEQERHSTELQLMQKERSWQQTAQPQKEQQKAFFLPFNNKDKNLHELTETKCTCNYLSSRTQRDSWVSCFRSRPGLGILCFYWTISGFKSKLNWFLWIQKLFNILWKAQSQS